MGREFAGEPERVLAARVREIRVKLGMTQAAVAKAMTAQGIPMGQSAIAKIEACQKPVRVNEAMLLAAVLHTGLDDLVTDPAQNALAKAREEERDLLGRYLAAQHRLHQAKAALDSAAKAARDAAKQEAELQDLHAQAQYKTAMLAAGQDEGNDQ